MTVFRDPEVIFLVDLLQVGEKDNKICLLQKYFEKATKDLVKKSAVKSFIRESFSIMTVSLHLPLTKEGEHCKNFNGKSSTLQS